MPVPKIHLILKGFPLCDFAGREDGRHAVTTISVFDKLKDDERCEECAAKLTRLRALPSWRTGSAA